MNNKGFTLIELVVSFSITVIMLGIVTVSFISLERHSLIKSAYILRTNLRYCQKNAMEEKRKYEISLNVIENLYYIKRADDSGLLRTISQVKLMPGVKFQTNATDKSIDFTPQGTTGDACTITLSTNHYYLDMTINVGCGRVYIDKMGKLS